MSRKNKRCDYEVRYGAPWHYGERNRRYYVFAPPGWLRSWWSVSDPIDREIRRFRMTVNTFFGLVFRAIFVVMCITFFGYLFLWNIIPFVIDQVSAM